MTPAARTPLTPGPNRPPGVSCSPMCGATDGSCHQETPTAARRTEVSCLKPIARSARPARAETAASRLGSVAARSSVALRAGWTALSVRAGTATPSRSKPARARSAIGSSPGSSEPRKADVRLLACPSRSVSSAVNSSVRRPSRLTSTGSWPATSMLTR